MAMMLALGGRFGAIFFMRDARWVPKVTSGHCERKLCDRISNHSVMDCERTDLGKLMMTVVIRDRGNTVAGLAQSNSIA
jgi:hypothetical protein